MNFVEVIPSARDLFYESWEVFAWRLPTILGLFAAVVLGIWQFSGAKRIKSFEIFAALAIAGAVASVVVSAVAITWLGYKTIIGASTGAFSQFSNFTFAAFWAPWAVGIATTFIFAMYLRSRLAAASGLHITKDEILVFTFFGILSAWPGTVIYFFLVLGLYVISAAWHHTRQNWFIRVMPVSLRSVIQQRIEPHQPFMPILIVAAPISLFVSAAIFNWLHLSWLYLVFQL